MVQDDEFVFNGRTDGFKFANAADDALRGDVASGIVVLSYNGMLAVRLLDEVVQNSEIVVIPREAHSAVGKGVCQVDGVKRPAHAHLTRQLHVVGGLAQQSRKQGGGRIIVEIEPHEFRIRATCSGGTILNFPPRL